MKGGRPPIRRKTAENMKMCSCSEQHGRVAVRQMMFMAVVRTCTAGRKRETEYPFHLQEHHAKPAAIFVDMGGISAKRV